MLSFTAPLYTADVGRAERFRPIRVVTRTFSFGMTGPDDSDRVIVPAGFCSDGASVPWFAQFPISNWGKYAQAAIVHDFLYATHLRTRNEADDVFRTAIRVLGSDMETDGWTFRGLFSAEIGYWAVALFGQRGYRDGPYEYGKLAGRAKKRATVKDPPLAEIIIENADDLIAHQSSATQSQSPQNST